MRYLSVLSFRSPLLRETQLLSSPLPTDMLKLDRSLPVTIRTDFQRKWETILGASPKRQERTAPSLSHPRSWWWRTNGRSPPVKGHNPGIIPPRFHFRPSSPSPWNAKSNTAHEIPGKLFTGTASSVRRCLRTVPSSFPFFSRTVRRPNAQPMRFQESCSQELQVQ